MTEQILKQSQIERVEYESDTLTVTFSIPHDYGTQTYTESFFWGPDYPPKALKEAAATFFRLLTDTVNCKIGAKQAIKCGTCTGACCRNWEGGIRVNEDDIVRMEDNGINPRYCVELWDGHQFFNINYEDGGVRSGVPREALSIDGSVGVMKMVPWKGLDKKKPETACVNLKDTGCSIYEHRPDVCRAFPAIHCEKYEEDTRKSDGLIQLRVKP